MSNSTPIKDRRGSYAVNEALVARLRSAMLRAEVNARELAEKAEVGRSFVYDVLSGKSTNPTMHKMAAVAKALRVSVSYLLHGEDALSGAGFENHIDDNVDLAAVASLAVEASMGGGTLVSEELDDKPFFFRKSWIRDRLKVTPNDLRVIRVRGDSMLPTLSEADVVLIDITKQLPSPPGIFVLFDGCGLVVKRLELLPSSESDVPVLRILSDNGQYAAYERLITDIRIIGRVVWFAREIS